MFGLKSCCGALQYASRTGGSLTPPSPAGPLGANPRTVSSARTPVQETLSLEQETKFVNYK